MADLDRIKRNVAKMAGMNAPVEDIDGYIASEGVTIEEVRVHKPGTTSPEPDEEANPETFGGTAMNATAGLNEGLYAVAGAPVDLVRGAMNLGIRGVNAATGSDVGLIRSDSFGGSEWIGETLGGVAPELNPENTVATTSGDRLARAAGQGVGSAVAPEAAVGAMIRSGQLSGRAAQMAAQALGRGESAAAASANAVVGGVSGAGAEAAMEAAPDEWDAVAGMAGGLAAGGAAALATAVPSAVRAGARFADDATAPMRADGRERLAAEKLREGATDAAGARERLEAGVEEIVPGSAPTTGQITGDMGLLGMERAAQAKNAEPFAQRRTDQNAARVGALEGVQPGGAPEAVANAIRQRFQMIDDETQSALDAARGEADTMRRAVDADSQTALDDAWRQADALRRGVDDETGTTLAGATRAAQDGAGALGTGATPDVAGDRARGALESARKEAKAKERALWDVVDPDGSLVTGTGNLRAAAKRVVDEMPDTAEPLSVKEAGLYQTISALAETAPFRSVDGLRRRLGDALKAERRENGETEMYRRLSIMREGLEQDFNGAIVRKVADQQQAVARGEMQIEDTIEAAWLRQREEWFAGRRAAEAATARAAGDEASAGLGAVGAVRTTAVSPAPGGNGQAGGRLSNTPGDPRLPANDLDPNFDAAARDRLKAATTASRERAETFDNKTLGPLRARPSTTAAYDVGSSSVPGKLFATGPKSFDAIETYRRAVGDSPEAMGALRDFAVDKLLRLAGRPDGTLDPAKARTFRSMHRDALRSFPDLDAQIQRAYDASDAMAGADKARTAALRDADKQATGTVRDAERLRGDALKTAGKPTEAETLAEKGRSQALKDADAGTLGKLRAETDRTEIGKLVGKAFDATASAQEVLKIKSALGKDPAAKEGLKRAVVDEMTRRFVSNAEAGTSEVGALKSDGFQTFIRKNRAALKGAGFDDEQIDVFDQIAADLQQANRSIVAVKSPGDSNTAEKLTKIQAGDKPASILMKVVLGMAGAGVGAGTGGVAGAAMGAVVAPMLAEARRKGFEGVDGIVADALLNPEKAKLLLSRPTGKLERDTVARLGKLYRNGAVASGAVVLGEEEGGAPTPADRSRPDSPRLTDDDRQSAIPQDLVDDGKQVLNGEREPAAPKSKLAELEARAKERRAARAA